MALSTISRVATGKRAFVATAGVAALTVLLMVLLYFLNSQHVVSIEFRTVDIQPGERRGWEVFFDLAFILTLGLVSFYQTRKFGLFKAFPIAIIFSLVYLELAYWLINIGYRVNVLYPLLSMFVSLLVSAAFRYFVLERSLRELKQVFTGFRPDRLEAHLKQEPEAALTAGDSKEVTIIFTDIKGFTSFSEVHPPQEVVNQLNEYLGVMVQVIEEFDGYVDKFIGDGIMAYWGAPFAQPDHANLAIACVLAMQDAMFKLHEKWKEQGIEPFEIRTGVQSGEVVAGYIGLRGKKMEYTVIGDTVNQAARLEGSAKYYAVGTLVGEKTYQLTADVYNYRELDKIRMLGKQVPVTVYELIGPQREAGSRLQRQFAQALETYRACQWPEAEQKFRDILTEFPDDRPTAMYIERCQYFRANPVEPGWDGVFNRRGK